jgi:hypothetical protein
MESAVGGGVAGLPEKRDTARSNPPQKKCTGLDLPVNRARKTLKTVSISRTVCQ